MLGIRYAETLLTTSYGIMSQFIAQNKRAFTHRDKEAFNQLHNFETRASNSKTYTHREAFGFAESGDIIEFPEATILQRETTLRELAEKLKASLKEKVGNDSSAVDASVLSKEYTTFSSLRKGSFYGNVSVEQTLQDVKKGWDTGLQKMFAALDDITAMGGVSKVPDVRQDVAGDEPNIAAYTAGQPENMTRYEWPEAEAETITLRVSSGAPAGVSSDALINRGAAIVHAVEELEAAGVGVEIIGEHETQGLLKDSTGRKPYLHSYVTLKKAGQRPNLSRITFALAHPCMLRRLSFAEIEQLPLGVSVAIGLKSGYGMATEDLKDLPLGSEKTTIFIPPVTARTNRFFKTPEGAANAIAEVFSEAGFNLETNQ